MPGDIPVLYADAAVVAVNKPSGLPVLPDGYDPAAPHLVGLLRARLGELWVVHRLDRGTSGVLLFARTAEAHRTLNLQFDRHQVWKTYLALVVGAPAWDEVVETVRLRPDGDRKHRTVPDPARGKPSVTRFRVLERLPGCVLVEALPETGRTHQIRAHLRALGHPIAGDPLYGGGAAALTFPGAPDRTLIGRPALHASSIAFLHPGDGRQLRLDAPSPEDLAAALSVLRSHP